MSQELIYTSAPRGVAPNSSGFCTVAYDGGMSRLLTMKLEKLSAYDFHFDLSDPRSRLNPENFIHTRLSAGGEQLSVLSRVAFSGADYSHRTNKIGHHFRISSLEQMPEGPAWMLARMAEKKLFREEWTAAPTASLPPRNMAMLLPDAASTPLPPQAWAKHGDPGWAGMLAKAVHENKAAKTPSYIVYNPGERILPLFEESLALLPREDRWQVCFATYYSAMLLPECHYQWRGVLAGSPAAREIARFPNALVIDLTKPLPMAEDNRYTEAARSGHIIDTAPAHVAVSVPKAPEFDFDQHTPVVEEEQPIQFQDEAAEQHRPELRARRYPSFDPRMRRQIDSHERPENTRDMVKYTLALAVLVLLCLTILFLTKWRGEGTRRQEAEKQVNDMRKLLQAEKAQRQKAEQQVSKQVALKNETTRRQEQPTSSRGDMGDKSGGAGQKGPEKMGAASVQAPPAMLGRGTNEPQTGIGDASTTAVVRDSGKPDTRASEPISKPDKPDPSDGKAEKRIPLDRSAVMAAKPQIQRVPLQQGPGKELVSRQLLHDVVWVALPDSAKSWRYNSQQYSLEAQLKDNQLTLKLKEGSAPWDIAICSLSPEGQVTVQRPLYGRMYGYLKSVADRTIIELADEKTNTVYRCFVQDNTTERRVLNPTSWTDKAEEMIEAKYPWEAMSLKFSNEAQARTISREGSPPPLKCFNDNIEVRSVKRDQLALSVCVVNTFVSKMKPVLDRHQTLSDDIEKRKKDIAGIESKAENEDKKPGKKDKKPDRKDEGKLAELQKQLGEKTKLLGEVKDEIRKLKNQIGDNASITILDPWDEPYCTVNLVWDEKWASSVK